MGNYGPINIKADKLKSSKTFLSALFSLMHGIIMKIGLDIHGVIDAHPNIFAVLTKNWIDKGHEIYIITGQEWQKAKPIVEASQVQYHHHFSIVDYHIGIGTKMYARTDKDGWWMDSIEWNKSKGQYVDRENIQLHFDDSKEYLKYFPIGVTYIVVGTNFHKISPIFLNI